MKTKINTFLLILSSFAILFVNTASGFADDEAINQVEVLDSGSVEDTGEDTVIPDYDSLDKQEKFLNRLQNELNLSKTEYRTILNNIDETKQRLDQVEDRRDALKKQLDYIDDNIAKSTKKLISVIGQVVTKENDIALTYEQIDMSEVALAEQKNMLKDYVRILYQQENELFDIGEDGQIDTVKLLLSDESVGENLQDLQNLDLLNEAGQQIVEKLDNLTKDLRIKKSRLQKSRITLKKLEQELIKDKAALEDQKEAKEKMMRLTYGQEKIYSELISQSIKEQEQSLQDVQAFSTAYAFIQKKIKEDPNFNPDDYASIFDDRMKAIYNFEMNLGSFDSDGIAWPVDPDRGISAFFRDPNYRAVFGVGHNAVDIPAYQGSPVRAAADGVVYAAKDNGYGYSYIILAHAGGIQTVYGHISEILVEPGDLIDQGMIIGLSGGMPGTKGAGYMTTGPHLHFEVLQNGNYVDPLDFLPLDVFTKDDVANFPEKYVKAWELTSGPVRREKVER